MTGGREPLSRPSSRHGEARHPLTLTFSWLPLHERPARLPVPRNRTLKGGGNRYRCSCRRKGGACRLSLSARETMTADSECLRGQFYSKLRPQEQVRRASGTERVISPAPLLGALRGVPAEAGNVQTACGLHAGRKPPPFYSIVECASQDIKQIRSAAW